MHRLLIKPIDLEEKTESGIIVKWDKREQAAAESGIVVDMGSTCFDAFGTTPAKEQISVGSKVLFAKYSGKEVKDGDKRFLLMNDEDIVGVITDE